jgi:hypothetical protein
MCFEKRVSLDCRSTASESQQSQTVEGHQQTRAHIGENRYLQRRVAHQSEDEKDDLDANGERKILRQYASGLTQGTRNGQLTDRTSREDTSRGELTSF